MQPPFSKRKKSRVIQIVLPGEVLHFKSRPWRGASNLASRFVVLAIHSTRGVCKHLSGPHHRRKYICITEEEKETLKLNEVLKEERGVSVLEGEMFLPYPAFLSRKEKPGERQRPGAAHGMVSSDCAA